MSNPFSGDTTTTGAKAGNAAYNLLSSEATDETNAIADDSWSSWWWSNYKDF